MHEIQYLRFDESISKKEISREANEVAIHNSDSYHGLYHEINFHNTICLDEDEAMEFIKKRDSYNYDQIAVRYYEYPKLEPSKALVNLQDRLKKEKEKETAYEKAHAVQTFKSEYIGCPKCGSKLKRELLRNNSCPLCFSDLRGKTTLDTLEKYKNNQKELNQKIRMEERKLHEKMKKKAKVKWLVKIEYHC